MTSMRKSTFKTIHRNATWVAFARVDENLDLCFSGKKRMLLVCSAPGLGKTERILRRCRKHGSKPHYASPTNATGLCIDLWKHRNSPYLLDDVDTLARIEACANVIKMAFGPQRIVIPPTTGLILRNEDYRLKGHPKFISDDPSREEFRNAVHPRYDPNIPPPEFTLGPLSSLVWSSNKNYTDPNVIATELQPDFAALLSRGLDPVWIPNEPQELLDFTLHMVVAEGMLRGLPFGAKDNSEGAFSAEVVNEVLRFFCENAERLKEISPRAIWKLAMSRRNDPNYQAAWKEALLAEPKWQLDVPEIPQVGPGSRKGHVHEVAPKLLGLLSDDPPKESDAPEAALNEPADAGICYHREAIATHLRDI